MRDISLPLPTLSSSSTKSTRTYVIPSELWRHYGWLRLWISASPSVSPSLPLPLALPKRCAFFVYEPQFVFADLWFYHSLVSLNVWPSTWPLSTRSLDHTLLGYQRSEVLPLVSKCEDLVEKAIYYEQKEKNENDNHVTVTTLCIRNCQSVHWWTKYHRLYSSSSSSSSPPSSLQTL